MASLPWPSGPRHHSNYFISAIVISRRATPKARKVPRTLKPHRTSSGNRSASKFVVCFWRRATLVVEFRFARAPSSPPHCALHVHVVPTAGQPGLPPSLRLIDYRPENDHQRRRRDMHGSESSVPLVYVRLPTRPLLRTREIAMRRSISTEIPTESGESTKKSYSS